MYLRVKMSRIPGLSLPAQECLNSDNPLIKAISNGNVVAAKNLLKSGAVISEPNMISSLEAATYNNHFKVIELVANWSRRRKGYWLVDSFEIAIRNGNFAMLRLLFRIAISPPKTFHIEDVFLEAVKCKQLKMAKYILRETSFCSCWFHDILSDEETYRHRECLPLIWEIVRQLNNDLYFYAVSRRDFISDWTRRYFSLDWSRRDFILDWIDAVRSAIPGSRHERRFVSWFSQFLPRADLSTDVLPDPDRWNNLNDECPITMRTLRSSSLVLGCTHCRNAFEGYALWRWFFQYSHPKCPMCRSDMHMNTICEIPM